MSDASRVIVYGASGYTGKLIAESLHNRGIPFTAAGRSEERLRSAMQIVAERAGVESIDCEYREVEHNKDALAELLKGARVVANVVGPFIHLGEAVVQAALEAGCHYVDTTGEQNYMRVLQDNYGQQFADANLLLLPALAYMWSFGDLAAAVALEDQNIDSIDAIYYGENGVPSVASAESFMRMLVADHYYIKHNALTEWTQGEDIPATIPGVSNEIVTSSWGGAGEPLWYRDDDQVQNCRVRIGIDNNAQLQQIHAGVRQLLEATGGDPAALDVATKQTANQLFTEEPPKENPKLARGTVNVEAWGNVARRTIRLHYHSSYVITGELIAEGCRHLLAGDPRAVGFQPASKAFGHRELIENLVDNGFAALEE